ncbi:MAG: hypothetical protein PGN34_23820 [Methylobacterium frigidaeris]
MSRLFESGNPSDMLIGLLGKDGTRAENLIRVVTTIARQKPEQQDRLLSMLGRMIALRGESVSLPPGVYEMIETLNIDYERNPIFRRPFEMGERAERRRSALNLLNIARPDAGAENESAVATLPDEGIDRVVAAATHYLTQRTAEARQRLEDAIVPEP